MTIHLPVDHLVAVVSDLEKARIALANAGFTVTPIARHSEAMGTANACIMLRGIYIELMGIVAETPANEGWRTLLEAGPGLRGIALRSTDIAGTATMLANKDIAAEPVRDFSRQMPEGELRFSVIRLPRTMTPGLQCLYCQHHTPQLLWTPQAMQHANGATRITAASVAGSAALSMLDAGDGLPIADQPEGRIEIDLPTALSTADHDAIHRETGILIEKTPVS
ncbi:VOC family protein [Mesorhizobium sp. SB112]|uniref:VOC family protein n=1 Tax=Mesorhizobium sp. SB112 TaxID=3151853 RepID=UPI003264A26E